MAVSSDRIEKRFVVFFFNEQSRQGNPRSAHSSFEDAIEAANAYNVEFFEDYGSRAIVIEAFDLNPPLESA